MEANDVGVPQGGRDLNLTLDVNSVQVFDDALLTDRLDSHLTEKMHYGESGTRVSNRLSLVRVNL